MNPILTIDVVSDAVCPWCYIGKRRLEEALAGMPELLVEVRWRPFQLDATIPPGGVDRRTYMAKKFGEDRIAAIHERITEAGREAGIAFAFDKIKVSPNTLDAHRLIRWAQTTGQQNDIVERLFAMFFVEGRDIGDPATLVEAAVEAGMDRAIVERLLSGEADVDSVREEIAAAQRLGVSGVPFFIIDGRLGVSGAQPAGVLQSAILQALQPPEGEASA